MTHVTDRIAVSASGFAGGLQPGGEILLSTGSDPIAGGSGLGWLLYDTDDGFLYWDPDGTDAGAREHIATLSSRPTLTVDDFLII